MTQNGEVLVNCELDNEIQSNQAPISGSTTETAEITEATRITGNIGTTEAAEITQPIISNIPEVLKGKVF